MSLFFIVGVPGTGKSTVQHELKTRGYDAFDTDGREKAVAKWHNLESGYVHPKSTVKTADRTPEFLKAHEWRVPSSEIDELVKYSQKSKPVFLCGDVANEEEIADRAMATFALDVDEPTLKNRLATRQGDNMWGRQPHELEITLRNSAEAHKRYLDQGYIILDASKPVNTLVDKILSIANNLEQSIR